MSPSGDCVLPMSCSGARARQTPPRGNPALRAESGHVHGDKLPGEPPTTAQLQHSKANGPDRVIMQGESCQKLLGMLPPPRATLTLARRRRLHIRRRRTAWACHHPRTNGRLSVPSHAVRAWFWVQQGWLNAPAVVAGDRRRSALASASQRPKHFSLRWLHCSLCLLLLSHSSPDGDMQIMPSRPRGPLWRAHTWTELRIRPAQKPRRRTLNKHNQTEPCPRIGPLK